MIDCFLYQNGYDSQQRGPCCYANLRTPVSYDSMIEDARYLRMGQQLANDEWPPECHACENIEKKKSGWSLRQTLNNMFHNKTTGSSGLQYLVIDTGRLCNLQCRSCNVNCSTSWDHEASVMQQWLLDKHGSILGMNIQPADKILPRSPQTYDYANEDYSNLRMVSLRGGEPLYMPTAMPILEKIYRETNGRCAVNIQTNATIPLDLDKYPWLLDFESLSINISIDALGPRAEFIRTGCSWESVEKNINQLLRLRDEKKLYVFWSPTFSVLNIFGLHDTHVYMRQRAIPRLDVLNILWQPPMLSYSVLTDRERKYCVRYLQDAGHNDIANHVNKAKFNELYRQQFMAFMEHTKQFHGLDWQQYLIELYHLMRI